jgi:hypothetical protein
MYRLEVEKTFNGKTEHWTVWRRYKQFHALHGKMKKKKLPVTVMPPKKADKFDPKVPRYCHYQNKKESTRVGLTRLEVVEERVKMLHEYLQQACSSRLCCRSTVYQARISVAENTACFDSRRDGSAGLFGAHAAGRHKA